MHCSTSKLGTMASSKRSSSSNHKEKIIRRKEEQLVERRAEERTEHQNPDYEASELCSFHAVAPPGTVDLLSVLLMATSFQSRRASILEVLHIKQKAFFFAITCIIFSAVPECICTCIVGEIPEGPVHDDNEWNISVVDDTEPVTADASTSDTLPDGLVCELPIADEFQKPSDPEEMTNSVDDLDELRKQLEALNAD
ncbi:hypothetical protein Vadar_012452 [Vaccinium darrowii]|nr:hypothetical protein Vadar_012452 [Vaccinium darrowii]